MIKRRSKGEEKEKEVLGYNGTASDIDLWWDEMTAEEQQKIIKRKKMGKNKGGK